MAKEKFISIPRANKNVSNFPCWSLLDKDDLECHYRPLVMCKCGELTSIGDHHIHKDGTVTASYFHTHGRQPCGWHVHIKLENWIGIEFLPKVNSVKKR